MQETQTKEHKITIDNIEHIIIHTDQQIIVRKFNKKVKMWIEFIYDRNKKYNDDSALIELLRNEYIEQQKKSS